MPADSVTKGNNLFINCKNILKTEVESKQCQTPTVSPYFLNLPTSGSFPNYYGAGDIHGASAPSLINREKAAEQELEQQEQSPKMETDIYDHV